MTILDYSFDEDIGMRELIETANFLAVGPSTVLDTQGLRNVSWIAEVAVLSGGASPSVTITWQHSADNVNWFDIASETELTAAGNKQRVTAENRMRYVRVNWAIGDQTSGSGNIYIQAS